MTTQTQEKTLQEVVEVSVDDSTIAQITEANSLATTVRSLTISNNNEYANSGEFLKQIKTVSKIIDDSRKQITKPLDEAKRRVMGFFRVPLAELSDAEQVLKKAILSYQQEQERIRREAEAKAIAKAKAEEEKKRKALELRAKKAEESGNIAKAEMLQEKADDVYVPTVVHAPQIEKVQGISTKKVWKAKIIDANKIPQNVYINDEKVTAAIQAILNKLATATKGAMPIDGVEFYQEESLSAGRI